MPPKSARPASTAAKPSVPPQSSYLLAYNGLSAALWAAVLFQTVTIGLHEIRAAQKAGGFFGGGGGAAAVKSGLSSGKVYDVLERYTRFTQTLAGMEVLHSLFG